MGRERPSERSASAPLKRSIFIGASLAAVWALTVLVAACGGAETEAAPLGFSTAVASTPPVELRLTRPDRTRFEVSQLRGKKVLLFLFATYDLSSQAALEPLLRFLKKHPAISAVGIALQPKPAKLLELYGDYWQLPFPLTYDAENLILPGLSDLGKCDVVPAYVLLNESGRIADRMVGAATETQLDELLKRAPSE